MTAANSVPNLLRPQQVLDMTDEKARLEKARDNPHIQDKGEVVRALRRLTSQLEAQTPKPFAGADLDRAVKREQQLLSELLLGMPSQEEMRKSPPGAVGKHQEWEKRNKAKLAEWKYLRLRLNVGTQDPDVANIERYRPAVSSLSMTNTLVSGKQFHNIGGTYSPAVIFSEEQMAFLRAEAPDVAERLALMSNEQRAEVRDLAETGLGLPDAAPSDQAPETKTKGKQTLSPEERQARSDRMKKLHADRKAKKDQSTPEAPKE